MRSEAKHPDEYIAGLPEDRKEPITRLRNVMRENLPKGFEEVMSYGMIGFVVPHELYPEGYHCDPSLPLPFANLASQKNYIAVYHSGIYADQEVYDWFVNEYPKHVSTKLDMGKSCIRFKNTKNIPYDLIGELCGKFTVQRWIDTYESQVKRRAKST